MPMPKLPLDGSCRCGEIRFRISAAPLVTMACHCKGCQKMSASAFSCSAAIPADGFEVTAGKPVIGGMHGDDVHHYHCSRCKSWLYTKATGMDGFVNIRPTMLDDADWFAPFIETFTSTKFPWANTGATHSFAEFPPMDAYEGLARDYRAQAGSDDR
ncbi:GFA family protein [Rhizobium sp. CFBP 13726]|uniref:GFA family protein n=1 Tax=Rhizobium sp. CFBP 13726 TaxID=2775296 RepID=UPI0017816BA7|nr:GFA family protein [Rhizobium sp. CFBP 13726]MBD8651178.1 GFA family protein [Rhizobium sp. CFBP 13726]